jgi:hypothetical protein
MRSRAAWAALLLGLLTLQDVRADGVQQQQKVGLRNNFGFKTEAGPDAMKFIVFPNEKVDEPRLVVLVVTRGHVVNTYAKAERVGDAGRAASVVSGKDFGLVPKFGPRVLGKVDYSLGKDSVSKAGAAQVLGFHAFRQEAVLFTVPNWESIRKRFNPANGVEGWGRSDIFGSYLDVNSADFTIALEAARKSNLDIQRWSPTSDEYFSIEPVSLSSNLKGRPHVAGLDGGSPPTVAKLSLASEPEQKGRSAKANSGDNQPEREKGYRVGRSPLPDGFAFFTLVAGALSGIITFLLLGIGRSISRLPSEYGSPKHSRYKESKDDFSP